MINIEYVNGSIDLDILNITKDYESFNESCKNNINDMFADFEMLEEKVTLESTIMGNASEDIMIVYESEKKNIFAKIGESIIAIYNKFVEVVDMIIDKIKTHTFKKKSDLQKLDILLKKHPELKNEAVAAFNEGALDLSDVRSLKELDSAFDEILKMARKKDVDPKTLRGKWEKVKEKFEKDEKSWKIVKFAAATTTVIGAIVAVKTLAPKMAEATKDLEKFKQDAREEKAKILEELKNYKGNDLTRDPDGNEYGKLRLLLEMWRYKQEKYTAVSTKKYNVIGTIANGVTNFVDKYAKLDSDTFKKDLDKVAEKVKDREKSEYDATLKKAYDETIKRSQAQLDHFKDNKNEYISKLKSEQEARNGARKPETIRTDRYRGDD